MSFHKSLVAVIVSMAGLLGLAVFSFAQQPSKTNEKSIPREKYRFDGKTFAQWQEYALTELKVERRIEAIKAMQAFGVRGYGPEAAATIFQILREHCREFPDWGNYEVNGVFRDAFQKIGRPSVAVLLPGLNEPALQEFCYEALVKISLEPADVRVLVKITLGDSPKASSSAIEVLGRDLQARPNTDIRAALLEEMKQEATAKRFVEVLRHLFKEGAYPPYVAAVLGNLGEIARPAVPDLVAGLDSGYDPTSFIEALGDIRCDADKVVPALIGMMEKQDDYLPQIAEALGKFDPQQTKAAVPVLLKRLYSIFPFAVTVGLIRDGKLIRKTCSFRPIHKEVLAALQILKVKPAQLVPVLVEKLAPNDSSEPGFAWDPESLKLCLDYLEKIGPDAKAAIPALGKVFEQQDEARPQISRVLRAIGPAGEEALSKFNDAVRKGAGKQ